ncbi:hypothetical protein [Aeromonas bivalvium]|uniref:hypothetical protein n=1 Tax=Aeromonas bivalvium TaxID=440079 RepID=UPI0038D17D30
MPTLKLKLMVGKAQHCGAKALMVGRIMARPGRRLPWLGDNEAAARGRLGWQADWATAVGLMHRTSPKGPG